MGCGRSKEDSHDTYFNVSPPSEYRIGINAAGIRNFIARCGGRRKLHQLTTEDACNKYMLPITAENESSFCDFLVHEGNGEMIGTASVYVW